MTVREVIDEAAKKRKRWKILDSGNIRTRSGECPISCLLELPDFCVWDVARQKSIRTRSAHIIIDAADRLGAPEARRYMLKAFNLQEQP